MKAKGNVQREKEYKPIGHKRSSNGEMMKNGRDAVCKAKADHCCSATNFLKLTSQEDDQLRLALKEKNLLQYGPFHKVRQSHFLSRFKERSMQIMFDRHKQEISSIISSLTCSTAIERCLVEGFIMERKPCSSAPSAIKKKRKIMKPQGPKCYLQKVRLNQGGYDSSGRYWGVGKPLYRTTNDENGDIFFLRAETREMAKIIIQTKPHWQGARFFK